MNKFDKTYNTILNSIKLWNPQKDLFKFYDKQIYSDFSVKFYLINEMNNTVFPIPKNVLSFYVKEIFDNGFYYISECSMNKIVEDTKNSNNLSLLKINLSKLLLTKDKSLLFICLPYKLNIWKKELNNWFSEKEIESIFKEFDNNIGVTGTFYSGFLIIINADFLNELKDIEEAVEHEFIHLFENINEEKNDLELSFDLLSILQKPSEYKAYKVNLINRLEKLFNKYALKYVLKDTKKNRQIFLDKIFKLANDTKYPVLFVDYLKKLDNSKLLYSNMYFLWNMVHWKTKEYEDFRKEIYENVLI